MGTSRKVRLGQNRLDNILFRNSLLLWAPYAYSRGWGTYMGTSRKVRLGQNRLDNILLKSTLLLWAPYAREPRGWRTDMGTYRKLEKLKNQKIG